MVWNILFSILANGGHMFATEVTTKLRLPQPFIRVLHLPVPSLVLHKSSLHFFLHRLVVYISLCSCRFFSITEHKWCLCLTSSHSTPDIVFLCLSFTQEAEHRSTWTPTLQLFHYLFLPSLLSTILNLSFFTHLSSIYFMSHFLF